MRTHIRMHSRAPRARLLPPRNQSCAPTCTARVPSHTGALSHRWACRARGHRCCHRQVQDCLGCSPHFPHSCLTTVATLRPQTLGGHAPSGPTPCLLPAGLARREGGRTCFVQGFPGPTWPQRKLLEILENCNPPLWRGGRWVMLPTQPLRTGHRAPRTCPSTRLALQPAAATCGHPVPGPGGLSHPLLQPRATRGPEGTPGQLSGQHTLELWPQGGRRSGWVRPAGGAQRSTQLLWAPVSPPRKTCGFNSGPAPSSPRAVSTTCLHSWWATPPSAFLGGDRHLLPPAEGSLVTVPGTSGTFHTP